MIEAENYTREYVVKRPLMDGHGGGAMSRDNVIELDKYREPESRILSGRVNGIKARKDSEIDELVEKNRYVLIEIPSKILSISPSFLEAFFSNVVNKLGEEGFYQRVQFHSQGEYDITEDLEEALDRMAYRESTVS